MTQLFTTISRAALVAIGFAVAPAAFAQEAAPAVAAANAFAGPLLP